MPDGDGKPNEQEFFIGIRPLQSDLFPQGRNFVRRQQPEPARRQVLKTQMAFPHSTQGFHGVTDSVHHQADLPLLAFKDCNEKPRFVLVSPCEVHCCRGGLVTLNNNPRSQLRARFLRDLPLNANFVFLLHSEARVHEAVRKLPVVRQEKQAFRIEIKATHGHHALLDRSQQLVNGLAAKRITGRHEIARRLVQHVVAVLFARRLDQLSIQSNLIATRNDLAPPSPDNSPVHFYLAGFNQIFAFPSRSNSAIRQIFLQTHQFKACARVRGRIILHCHDFISKSGVIQITMPKLSAELDDFFKRAQHEIDHVLRALIAPHEEPIRNLDDAMAYALGLDPSSPGGGKRLRPLMCLLVCDSLCGKTRPALPFAAAIEIMHNFCLVHDDIEDGDEFRRGRPAVWKQYGLAHAINVGDYLFTKIFAALLSDAGHIHPETMVRFFALMGATLDHTHRGQALDINAREGSITVEQYMRLVTEKTGHYLAAPLVAGATAAGASQDVEESLNAFGLVIGPMFQIRDDLIDLTHGKGRDTIGSDIREGKRSFLVAYTCKHAGKRISAELLKILDRPRQKTTDAHVARALEIFNECGAMEEARKVCDHLKRQALETLNPLPAKLRDRLQEVTEYLAERVA